MKKDRSQLINAICIVIGGFLLIFQISGEDRNPYILILGLVILMFGLYRATNHWVYTKDDHKTTEEAEEEVDRNNDNNRDLN